jgi:hypothetical protein
MTEQLSRRFVRKIQIQGCAFPRADLLKLYKILNEKVGEAGDLEVRDWRLPPDESSEKFENTKQYVKGLFDITMTVHGAGGDIRIGRGESMLYPDNLPDRINHIYFNSSTIFKATRNLMPRAGFELFLDFKKPALLDFTSPASAPTPNASNISVESDDDTWANAVFQKVREFIEERNNNRGFVHRSNVYDFALLVVGFPLAFWAVWKVSPLIQRISGDTSGIVTAALYFYVFILTLWAFRFVFNYAKWAFPLLEIDSPKNRPAAHRAVWLVITLGVAAIFIYDLISQIFLF